MPPRRLMPSAGGDFVNDLREVRESCPPGKIDAGGRDRGHVGNRMTSRPSTAHSSPSLTLDVLAERARHEDAAFEALHRRLSGGLRRYLHRRSGSDDVVVEELVHTTWVEVWRALRTGAFDPSRARISTFVYAVGHKMVLRHLRTAKRDGAREAGSDEVALGAPADAIDQDDLLHTTEALDALRACVATEHGPFALTAEEREIVTRLALGGSERGLAVELGIAASTVNARKKTAYRKLQSCLRRKGFGGESAERSPGGGE